MTDDPRFPELVSLACHDLRTPLATVAGFASTLLRIGDVDPQRERYLTLIDAAATQLGEIIDDLGVVARIEGGRFEPADEPADSLDLVTMAARQLGNGSVRVGGTGAAVRVDRELSIRAIRNLAGAAIRHGGVETVDLTVDGTGFELSPVSARTAEIVRGDDLRDLGSAAARRALEAQGASVTSRGGAICVDLPRG
ncbi:MAG: sensor histidine kinase [Gaiellaceae bacterium]